MERKFVNYAHRGASEYCPENTLLSFYTGVYMGANGIETDVQRTKDGVLVLFHDDDLKRIFGLESAISDHTLAELQQLRVKKADLEDRIVTLGDFLRQFAFRPLTFAIELKQPGIEAEVAAAIRRYDIVRKTVVTSFDWENILRMRQAAPELESGYLTSRVDDELLTRMKSAGCLELCPHASLVTAESVQRWHDAGFRVRAWGVKDEALMRQVYDSCADGMTVNFPDKLTAYMTECARDNG